MSTIKTGTTLTTAYQVVGDTTGALVIQTGASPTTAMTISSAQVATFAQAPVLPAASIPQAALAAGVAGNGPAFSAVLASNQSVTASTTTKIAYSVEQFDTNSNYDTGTYRFTPTVAGYYEFNIALISFSSDLTQLLLHKNGTPVYASYPNTTQGLNLNAIVYANGSSDYFEAYIVTTANASIRDIDVYSYFQGFLVRAA